MTSQKELIYNLFRNNDKALLIVLDACRFDILKDNLDTLSGFRLYYYPVNVSASCTEEWVLGTFTEPLLDVVYVTANAWVPYLLRNKNIFKSIIYVDRIRPEFTSVKVLKYILRDEKVIAHYVQPHPPFFTSELAGVRSSEVYRVVEVEKELWNVFRCAYTENLRYVLRAVKRIIETALSRGYRVALTSDHGELLGDYNLRVLFYQFKRLLRKRVWITIRRFIPYLLGVKRVFGHPPEFRVPELTVVPWVYVWY